MKKKGFTLIEIIVCIVLIVIIGTSCFFGIRTIRKNILIEKLEQITDKALLAAEIYIETNKETYNKLYSEKNGVVLPLNLLVNEGLLDISGTTLEDKDIENEYILTAFTGNGGSNDCINITANASWTLSNSNPIYICTSASGGSSNLTTISTYDIGNMNLTSRERYYFRGENPNNYIKLKGNDNIFRIMYVDIDDSLMLYMKDYVNPATIFGANNLVVSNYDYNSIKHADENVIITNAVYCLNNNTPETFYKYNTNGVGKILEGYYSYIDILDVLGTIKCSDSGDMFSWLRNGICYLDGNNIKCRHLYPSWYKEDESFGAKRKTTSPFTFDELDPLKHYKFHLKSCYKITDGTGDYSTPFILENKCTS